MHGGCKWKSTFINIKAGGVKRLINACLFISGSHPEECTFSGFCEICEGFAAETAVGQIDHMTGTEDHIGGLDAAAETTLNLPKIPGGKKLIYTHLTMPLTALTDLRAKGAEDARFTALADIVDAHNGLWCPEAEEYLLANFQQHD